MPEKDLYQHVADRIAENNTSEALAILQGIASKFHTEDQHSLTLLQARYQQHESERLGGTEKSENLDVSLRKLQSDILTFSRNVRIIDETRSPNEESLADGHPVIIINNYARMFLEWVLPVKLRLWDLIKRVQSDPEAKKPGRSLIGEEFRYHLEHFDSETILEEHLSIDDLAQKYPERPIKLRFVATPPESLRE